MVQPPFNVTFFCHDTILLISVGLYDDAWQGLAIGVVAIVLIVSAGKVHLYDSHLVFLVLEDIVRSPGIHEKQKKRTLFRVPFFEVRGGVEPPWPVLQTGD